MEGLHNEPRQNNSGGGGEEERRGEMTDDEVKKQSLERFMWQLEFEEMRFRAMAREEITVAMREFVDRFLENLETISAQEASQSFWRRLINKFFGRPTLIIVKETMIETAETVIVGIGKGLKP
jgi:hypothetical protein